MHDSSFVTLGILVERYINGDRSETVLDVGGGDYNGSYKNMFISKGVEYYCAELESAPADQAKRFVVSNSGVIQCESNLFDYVVSGQMLEHCEDPIFTVKELARVLKPGGLLFLITPSAGPDHKYPIDCYRFYPDSYYVFAKHANLHVVETYLDDLGPWNDLSGVFQKPPIASDCSRINYNIYTLENPIKDMGYIDSQLLQNIQVVFDEDDKPVEPYYAAGQEEISYLSVLEKLHKSIAPKVYVEIGTRNGASLLLSDAPISIAIDPAPDISRQIRSNETVYAITSDRYFRDCDQLFIKDETTSFDLAFIDGMHLAEFVLRDFINLEKRSHAGSIIVIDDILPPFYESSLRTRRSNIWVGDTWKAMNTILNLRKDLDIQLVECAPSAMAIVRNLKSNNRDLLGDYNPLTRAYKEEASRSEVNSYVQIIKNLMTKY